MKNGATLSELDENFTQRESGYAILGLCFTVVEFRASYVFPICIYRVFKHSSGDAVRHF